MTQAVLTVDLAAIAENWRAFSAMAPGAETAAVIKADAYGLGAARVGPALMAAGARTFFVAIAEEAAALRAVLGAGPRIYFLSGIGPGDAEILRATNVTPVLNSLAQVREARAIAAENGAPLSAALQLDSGMNRLGLEPGELNTLLDDRTCFEGLDLTLILTHLACADEQTHPMNAEQRRAFLEMIAHPRLAGIPRSLAATGGALMGPDWHFDMIRPGIGLYGGLPYTEGRPVVRLDVPIVQVRDVAVGETVGYANAFTAKRPTRVATVPVGYADGLHRGLGAGFEMHLGGRALPSLGRISMDLITLDVTEVPEAVEGSFVTILDERQGADRLAAAAGTIGYEILTSLGARFKRRYTE